MPTASNTRMFLWDYSGVTPLQLHELGLSSIQELAAVRDARTAARKQLAELLARAEVPGPEKQHARCAYIHQHGRLPYQCKTCWLLPGFCVCSQLRKAQPATQVVIHLHQDEWGRGSNTGCLCAASLSGCELLLRGYEPHDQYFAALLADPSSTTALLWPSDDALEPHQLQQLAAARSNGRITLVAIDATWGGAMRMRRRYPQDMLTVRLPPDLALPQLHHGAAAAAAVDVQQIHPQDSLRRGKAAAVDTHSTHNGSGNSSSGNQSKKSSTPQQQQPSGISRQKGGNGRAASVNSSSHSSKQAVHTNGSTAVRAVTHNPPRYVPTPGERVSLFRGVRKYHGQAELNGRVSTLEAVAAALLALEGDEEVYVQLLHNLKLKVDAMRQQKHMPPVYALLGEQDGGDEGEGQQDGQQL